MNKEIHNQSKDPEESIKMEAKSSVSKDKESKDRKQETKKESPQEEIALLKNQLLRSMADMENLRKRFSKELEDKLKYYNADFIEKLLPVFDNLERALRSIPQDEVKKNKLLNNLFIGIGAIQKEISAVFERFQISKFLP